MQNTIQDIFINGVKTLGLNISPEMQGKFFTYIELLQKWNKTYNLTAIDDTQEILIKHILDSLVITPYIKGPFVLDYGSGAGLPGIPLALCLPDIKFVLLDSNLKKIKFLNHVVFNLKLPNVGTLHSRVEEFQFEQGFDTIITRATGSLHDIIMMTKHLLSTNGQLLVMKGKYPENEIAEIDKIARTFIHKLQVPYLDAERHLACITLI